MTRASPEPTANLPVASPNKNMICISL
jgi:hypothetical protein